MITAPKDMLVLKSEAGDYYVLPWEMLERGRIPADHTAEAERLFAATEGDDVAGHLNFTKIEFDFQTMGGSGDGATGLWWRFAALAASAGRGG
jgi:hypothetical protein